jgi:hypothetical protein
MDDVLGLTNYKQQKNEVGKIEKKNTVQRSEDEHRKGM